MPAYNLTRNCIWNSFQNSKKQHIIITGNRGVGKSTLLHQLFPNTLPGVTTWAIPQTAVYLKDNTSNETVKVGVFDSTINKTENKMTLCSDGFSILGIETLKNALLSNSEWISIDEIGYLESQCRDYLDMVMRVMDEKHVIAIVRKQNLSHLKKLCERNDVFLIDLDAPFGNIGCIIMASGLGARFGQNKLMVNFNEKPLISYILDATSGLFQRRIVVTRHEEVATFCKEQNIEVLLHTMPHQSDTIRLGLEKLLDMDYCMFCTADQPLLRKETITALSLLSVNTSHQIVRPIHEKTPGSPVVFPQWTFDKLLHLPEGKGGGYVINQHANSVTYLSIANSYELEDIDTQEDYIRLQEKGV